MTFACVLFILAYYIHTRKQENEQQKQLGYSIFHLKGTEYESMKPQKYVKSHVLTWNIGVFKNCFMFFIMKQHESSVMVCYGMNKCVLWNVQIIIKLKKHKNSFNKVQTWQCAKIVLWVGSFHEEIWAFILYEHNEGVVTDIFKMEDIFGMFFPQFLCLTLLFCDYKKKVGMKLILYVCSWNLWSDYYREKCSLKQYYENSGTFSVAHGNKMLGNSKIYIQFFT